MKQTDEKRKRLLQYMIENCPVKSDFDLADVMQNLLYSVMKEGDVVVKKLPVDLLLMIEFANKLLANRKRGVIDYSLNVELVITTLDIAIKAYQSTDKEKKDA